MNIKQRYLQKDTINEIINYFQSFIVNKEIIPGTEGKRFFFQNVVKRKDFLPRSMQELIERDRGKTSQEDYLLSHPTFNSTFLNLFQISFPHYNL